MLKLLRSVSLASLLACVPSLLAQSPTPTPHPLNGDDVIKVSSRLVVVPVSVTDANGNAVLGLNTQDFRIAEEGKVQTIENVGSADKVPLEIALLFDISASTDTMFKFELETAAKFLKDVMRSEDRATVFTIGERPVLLQPRDTADRTIATIRTIAPTKGFTAFYDTVGDAAAYLRKNAPEGTRRVVLVISDGEDTNSAKISKALQDGYQKLGDKINRMDQKMVDDLTVNNRDRAAASERIRVLQLLQNADTVFYSINPAGSSYQLNKMSVFGQENMEKFAGDTGGTAFLPRFLPVDTKDIYQNGTNTRTNSEKLDRIFRQLASELRSQYLIQYYSEADYPTGRYVKVEVSVPTHGGPRVRARQGYYVKNN